MGKFVQVASYQIHYETQGRSTHPPLLFLHGFMGDVQEFSSVLSLLADRFYCVAVDLPGHGKTQTEGGNWAYTMTHTANGLIQFLDALGLPPCGLVGYSMGGRLALYLSLHFPSYFSYVILESASPGLKTPIEQQQRLQKDLVLAHTLETEDFSTFLTHWYNQPLFASLRHHPSFRPMFRQRLQNNPIELARSLRSLSTGQQPSLWHRLTQHTVPTLLLAGALDQKFVQINTEMANRCRGMTLKIVQHCGHNIHLENGAVFTQELLNFFVENQSYQE